MAMVTSNAMISHVFWTLLVGTYGVNNRRYPVNDIRASSFLFQKIIQMTAVAQHLKAYAVMCAITFLCASQVTAIVRKRSLSAISNESNLAINKIGSDQSK